MEKYMHASDPLVDHPWENYEQHSSPRKLPPRTNELSESKWFV